MAHHYAQNDPAEEGDEERLAPPKPSPGWTLEVPLSVCEPRSLVITKVVELEDAPGFVMPRFLIAELDSDEYPAIVRIHAEAKPAGLEARRVTWFPRVDPRPEVWDWLGDTPRQHMGALPALPLPRLLDDLTAMSAVPIDNALVSQMYRHTATVRGLLRGRRAPRTSVYERALIRRFDDAARADPRVATPLDRREYVLAGMHEELPTLWLRRDDLSYPDSDRMRRYLAELDRERSG